MAMPLHPDTATTTTTTCAQLDRTQPSTESPTLNINSSNQCTPNTCGANTPTAITPRYGLFLQESDNTRELEFFMPQEYVWSDWRTTYHLLPMGNGPDKLVEILVTGWSEVEMLYHSPQDPRVGLREPLGKASIANFRAIFCLRKLRISLSSCVSWLMLPCVVAMTVKERARTTRGHVITPWGEGCWVISSKIAEF